MEENKKYIIGDFEYEAKSGCIVETKAYLGPTGPGTVVTIPDKVEYEGQTIEVWSGWRLRALLSQKQIEKIIIESAQRVVKFEDMPILESVVVLGGSIDEILFENCPALKEVVFHLEVPTSVPLEKLTAGNNVHVVFGDEVEEVGIIRGGHVTLGKGVKEIKALKKAEFGIAADTTIAEYELPTRIDFLSPEPPTVGAVAPGSMTVTELHVPAGALDAYMNHNQWGKAAYFVEEGGKTVDNYAAKHKARIKKLEKERSEREANAAEEAKAEKVKAMGKMMHSTLAMQRLAKWNPTEKYGNYIVTLGTFKIDVGVPEDAPIDIWDKIVAEIEEIEAKLSQV